MSEITLYAAGSKGYGAAGASHTKRAMKGFTAMSGSPKEDIDYNNYTMRQRGRMLYMSSPVATSAIKTHRTNTVGLGLKLNPRINREFLGLTSEAAEQWERLTQAEFALWANRKQCCDATGMNDFYELQQLAFTSWLTSGDILGVIKRVDDTKMCPYTLRLHLIEADRCSTPMSKAGYLVNLTEGVAKNGNRIYDGVEVNKSGAVTAYYFRNTYPFEMTAEPTNWVRVEAVGELTGLPNVIHLMTAERPDQYRGVSFLAPVIEAILQIRRYTESELTAALVESFFTAFIKTEADTSDMPFNDTAPVDSGTESEKYDPNEYEMGPGQINVMNPGEDVTFADPKRPASGFDAFVKSICTQIGAALEIPRDLLLKEFNASYSASRAALLEAWKSFKMYREWFSNDFCRPIYEIWLTEAVARGRISAPGFFNDPLIRDAWLGSEWVGPSQGQLDPVKEITAEILAISEGLSTREDSTVRLNGGNWNSNVDQLSRESQKMKDLKVSVPAPEPTPKEPDNPDDDPEQNEDIKNVISQTIKDTLKEVIIEMIKEEKANGSKD